jgi:hypothetical protein
LAAEVADVRHVVGLVLLACAAAVHAEDSAASSAEVTGSLTGYYNALPSQPNYGSAVGYVNVGALHLESRYNYEGRAALSGFVGWSFSGGKDVTWSITPLAGAVTGSVSGFVPGLEATLAYGPFDFYVEAEYVTDRKDSNNNYFYAWSELGWKPVEWLRVGLVGQRTRVVQNERDLQRGLLLQLIAGKFTLGAYAFNPTSAADRYTTLALGVAF